MQPVCSENFHHFPITSCSHEKRYQALPAFLHVLQATKSWAGPGNEATCLILVVRFDHVMKFSNRWGSLLPCLLNSHALRSSQHILMYTLSQHHQTDSRIQNRETLYKTLFNKHSATLHFQLSKVLGTSACHSKQLPHYGRMKAIINVTIATSIHTYFCWCHLLMLVLAHMNLLYFSTFCLPLHAYTI